MRRIYKAEDMADHRYWGRLRSATAAQRLVDEIVSSRWWKNRSRIREVTLVYYEKGLGNALAFGRWIHLYGEDALTTGVLLHEMAHHLAGLHHGHDAVFARAYLELVRKWKSPRHAKRLQREFDAHRVEVAA